MMKLKVLPIFLMIVAILLCFGYAAAESNPIVASMELSPSKLTGPGTVNVTITISNSGNTDMKDPLVLYDPAGQIVADFGSNGSALLKAGESKTWTGAYDVNQRTLDNGSIIYYAQYTLYSESGKADPKSLEIRSKISMQTAEADIEVKRTINPTVAREDQEIVVKYDITNTGTVNLTGITIKEHANIHNKKETVPDLKPGQTAEIKFPVKMGKKDLTSGATITYKSENNKKAQTYTVENTKIKFGQSSLTAKLTSSSKGVPVNQTLMLTLELKNSGTLDYTDLRVTDPVLGDVFTNQKLEAGKSLKLEKEITLTASAEYVFTISAIDSTGTETSVVTDAVPVVAVNPEDVLTLTLTATPDRTEVYEQPGQVRFSVSITNTSSVEAKKVTVSHGNTDIYTFESIPAGETRKLTRDTALSMPGKYRFTATAQDPLENKLTFQSNEVQIAFSVPTPAPVTPTPPPDPTQEPIFIPVTMPPIVHQSIGALPKTVQSILLPVLIIAGLLFIGCGCLLIVATKRRADQRKASEAAFDHLERAKRRDYIAPAENEEAESTPPSTETPGNPAEGRRNLLDDDDLDEIELPHVKYARGTAETRNNVDEDDYSAIGQGLYDEEMTSDLSTYGDHSQEDVLYEQSYDNDAYPQDVYSTESDGYTDGYTDGYEGDNDYPADIGNDDSEVYDDGQDVTGYDESVYSSDYGDDSDYPDDAGDGGGVDGHMFDDRDSGDPNDSNSYDDSMFRRPAPTEDHGSSRSAGRRSRSGSGKADTTL